VEGGDTVKWFF